MICQSRRLDRNTEKLELPSLSQVHTRAPTDVPWYNPHYSQRPLLSSNQLPHLNLPQSYAATSSYSAAIPRSVPPEPHYSPAQENSSSHHSAHDGIGLKTPSPSPTAQHTSTPHPIGLSENSSEQAEYPHHQSLASYNQIGEAYSAGMNQPSQYMDSHQSYSSGGQSYPSQPATSQYPQYHNQPAVLQPGPGNYAPSPTYGQHYGYSNGVTSPPGSGHPVPPPMGSQMNPGMLPLPAMPPGGPSQHGYGVGAPGYPPQMNDTTGQVAPAGMKPRVTATLWEDEGSMCFQVEAKGVCVARRDDNHMINGTKLLNVAGMTRGRRDGILKSEKMRHVVKIGPMHLKGVWIPFERALDFANKEKITEMLYPLFVHNIGALLYHPTNSNRTNAVMAAAERRKLENKQQQSGLIGAPGSQAPSLHHHHSMNSSSTLHGSQPPHSIAPHPGAPRPSLDRAHTFPTPPTSASSGINMSQGNYEWNGQNMGSGVQGGLPIANDGHSQSTPNTPATTPPGGPMQSMHHYPNQQPYDSSRPLYSAPAAPSEQYSSHQNVQHQADIARPPSSNYMKHEMGPPSARLGSGTQAEHIESKVGTYAHNQGAEQVGQATGDEEADHEHDTDYPHDSNATYSASRGSYNYNSGPTLGSLHGEHAHISPEMSGSPHQNASGRMTPRTSTGSQPQWGAGYQTPPRAAPSSNLYNVMSDTRSSMPNGTTGTDSYSSLSQPSSYASASSHINGATPSSKRLREDEDDQSRAEGDDGLKRQRIARQGSFGAVPSSGSYDRDNRPINRARSSIVQRR